MEEESLDGSDADVPPAGRVSAPVPDSDADSEAWGDASDESGWFPDPDVEGQERYYDGSEWTSETRSVDVEAPKSHLPDHAGELQRALAAATDDIDDVEDRLGNLFERVEQRGKRSGRARKQETATDDRPQAGAPAVAADDEEADDEENWLSADVSDESLDAGDGDDGESDDALAELDEENWLSDEDDDEDSGDDAESDDAVAELDGENWLSDETSDESVDLDVGYRDDGESDDALAELDEALVSEEPEKLKRGLFRRR